MALATTLAWGQSGAPVERFQPTDIFITSYRGPSVSDPGVYQNSKEGRTFEAELQSDDDERFCLQAPRLERAFGVWKNDLEPAYVVHANARPSEAEAYASEHAKAHQQDAVLVFESAADGPDSEYVLSWTRAPAAAIVFDASGKAGFDGATLAGNKLLIVDFKAMKKSAAATLADSLGAKLETIRGYARLLDRPAFEKAMTIYDAFPHTCPGTR